MRFSPAKLGAILPVVALALLAAASNADSPSAGAPATSLGIAGAAATQPVKLQAFSDLPEATTQKSVGDGQGRISTGTEGLKLPAPGVAPGTTTVAILGDLAPRNAAGIEYLKTAVQQLNLLRPEMVFTVGNLVPGLTRQGPRYLEQVRETRGILDTLQMPWYPCVGEAEVVSGTRDPSDRRFEGLYQKYFGPLYFSLDAGAVHAIVLDTDEAPENAVSDAQLSWLRADLNRAFNNRQAQWIIVLLHRPLWRDPPADGGPWERVHSILAEFNHRPIVRVEGPGGPQDARRPRVVGVFAGAARAYSLDPPSDGIRYCVLGPTAALGKAGLQPADVLRQVMLLKFDAAGMHPAILRLDSPSGDALQPDDILTASERQVLDRIGSWGPEAMSLEATRDPRDGRATLAARLSNPLADPIDVILRPSQDPLNGDAGAVFAPFVPSPLRLAPGSRERREAVPSDRLAERPLDFVVRWTDPRGRAHDVTLRRPTPVIATAAVGVTGRVAMDGPTGWTGVVEGAAYAGAAQPEGARKPDPKWWMTADGKTFYVRVLVEDAVHSYWPRMALDGRWEGLPSDAVTIAWARDSAAPGDAVQRVWAVPFGPQGLELWTNTGVADRQTALLRLDPKWGVKASVQADSQGYAVTVALPRDLVFAPGSAGATNEQGSRILGSAVMNISVHDNDDGARTWLRSWAGDTTGPESWGRVQVVEPATGLLPGLPVSPGRGPG